MSLAGRVVKLLRANLTAYLSATNRAETYTGTYTETPTGTPAGTHTGTNAPYEPYTPREPGPAAAPPPDPTLAGFYANLELPYGADRAAVRAARRRLLSLYHPDRFQNDPAKARLANDLVQQLNHAHDELLKHLDS